MYANDIVLIAETPQCLQDLLDVLINWCNKGKLKCNLTKTKTVHYRTGTKHV